MKIKLSKNQWKYIGIKSGWIKKSNINANNKEDKSVKTYNDGDRCLKIFGPDRMDPNFKYDAVIYDSSGIPEASTISLCLEDIYFWAMEHKFKIKNEI